MSEGTSPKKQYTLMFLLDKGSSSDGTGDAAATKVLLGMKKRGLGEGKWNGFGGKVCTIKFIFE